jgi:hypothetical protein
MAWMGAVYFLSTPAMAQQGEQQLAPQRVSAVLSLVNDSRRSNPVDIKTVQALLHSTTLVGPAVESALGLDPSRWEDAVSIQVKTITSQALSLEVIVVPNESIERYEGAAQRVLDELTDRVGRSIEQANPAADDKRQQIKKLQSEVNMMQQSLDTLEQQRQEARNRQRSGRYSRAANQRQSYESMLQQARLALHQSKSLAEAYKQALASAEPEPIESIETVFDHVVSESKQRFEKLEKQDDVAVELIEQAYGAWHEARMQQAQARLRHQSASTKERLQVNLARQESEQLEAEAKIDTYQKLIDELIKQEAEAESEPDLDAIQREISNITQEMHNTTRSLQSQERELASLGGSTRLVVLDGRDDDEGEGPDDPADD